MFFSFELTQNFLCSCFLKKKSLNFLLYFSVLIVFFLNQVKFKFSFIRIILEKFPNKESWTEGQNFLSQGCQNKKSENNAYFIVS